MVPNFYVLPPIVKFLSLGLLLFASFDVDLIETLRRYITPLETLDDGLSERNAAFVQMGFPTQKVDAHPSLCITTQTFEREGYDCPRCKTKVRCWGVQEICMLWDERD